MDPNYAAWNKYQHMLQDALSDPEEHPEWIALFLNQHGQVHSNIVSGCDQSTLEDEVLLGMDEASLRIIPPRYEHSIAWILWHLARCEDLTMSMLVEGTDQVFTRQGWMDKIHTPIAHTGNEIDLQEITRFSQAVDMEQLKAYRIAVGVNTRQAVSRLGPRELGKKVDPDRILRIRQSGGVLPAAEGIINYWSKRSIAGLLLMPPTRHCITHLHEAMRLKHSLQRN